MDKAEKRRRRNISRKYLRNVAEDSSLKEYPACDGQWFMCDSCKRYKRGCGVRPFAPKEEHKTDPLAAVAVSADSFSCDGYL